MRTYKPGPYLIAVQAPRSVARAGCTFAKGLKTLFDARRPARYRGLFLLRSCYVGEATTLIVAILEEAVASLLVRRVPWIGRHHASACEMGRHVRLQA